jgi:hypothetical protein
MGLRSYIIYRKWKKSDYTIIRRNITDIITVLKVDATKGSQFYMARSFPAPAGSYIYFVTS